MADYRRRRRRRSRPIIGLVLVLLASLFCLRSVIRPTSLPTVVIHTPDLRRHLRYAPADVPDVESFIAAPPIAADDHGRQTSAASSRVRKVALAKTRALRRRFPAPEYVDFMFECKSGSTEPTEVFLNFVRLKYHVLEVRANSERFEVTYNPTIMAMPSSAHYPFLIVSRFRSDGLEQKCVICEAKYADEVTRDGYGFEHTEKTITCATNPIVLEVPLTPARDCLEREYMSSIPGYHDPRIFWSQTGAPLMIMNQQSRYGCFGLWVIDLRSVYPSLRYRVNRALLNQYPTVMELTRLQNRGPIEKNYMIFFDLESGIPYVQYELSPQGRHFSRLIGNGLASYNMTNPLEIACLPDIPSAVWHQATNALMVVLCNYGDCEPTADNTVYISFLHNKVQHEDTLKVEYSRYLAVWKAVAPFEMIGFASRPLRFENEDELENAYDVEGKFLYTVSIAWERHENRFEGYLNENILISLGIGDHANGAVILPARDLFACMNRCNTDM
ncbi:uncharacterized protein V1518DRAFT_408373 [Limtongia smithiae]|uniref:uncharacterized protein n=1 Tax=Limtongia smithiae TaxID=1125753 RepID=UPI0034CE5035